MTTHLSRRGLLGPRRRDGRSRTRGRGRGRRGRARRSTPTRRRRTRSTARTSPGSRRRLRTGCTSRPSTSPPGSTVRGWWNCSRTGPTAAARMTQGRPAGKYGPASGPADAPPGRYRRGARPAPGRPDPHLRLRTGPVHDGRGPRPLRDRIPPPRRARRPPPLPRRRAAGRVRRRRPLRAGVQRRPAGRGARHPQPLAHRVRARLHPLVAARFRAHLVDVAQSDDAAQPVRLQGRHGEHHVRGHGGRERAGVGRSRRRRRLDDGRLLPGGAQDPHGHRDVGPPAAGRAGTHHRADERVGCAALRGRRVHGAGLPRGLVRGRHRDRPGFARAARAPLDQRRRPAAAPRLQLRRRQRRARTPQRRACSSSRSSATRGSSSSPSSSGWRATTR